MTDTYTVRMEKMVYGGECLGRLPDGRAVFVPFVLPEELVQIELVEDKKRYARGWPLELIEPSPERIAPRCVHFGACGGCQYQHLDYTKQIEHKQAIMLDQFQRIAKIDDPPLNPIVPAPDPWHYRNTVQFHLGREGELGYVHADGEHLLPIVECHLPQEAINTLWPQIELGEESGVFRLGIRLDSYDALMLVMEGEDPKPPEFGEDIPVSAVYTPPDARLTVLAGEDHLVYTLLDHHFQVSARSFFQVNTPMAEKMVQHVLASLNFSGQPKAVELYAGVGLFSIFLASRVAHLTAIESSGSACHDFAVNLDAFDNVELYEAEAEAVAPSLEGPVDIVVMDPPRAGLAPAVHDALATLAPRQIAYISCDPATLARDVKKILQNGYKLVSVTPFDLFPQTSHIESVSIFKKEK
ncbi:MAG: class I SAM-dependent RNA methyltransferase [Chloroflexota bacterium]|nr:class I SAM-dependent RNA methyltransferase [Chloroflexota bacterium]